MDLFAGQSHPQKRQVALSHNGKKYTRYRRWRQDWDFENLFSHDFAVLVELINQHHTEGHFNPLNLLAV